MELLMVWFIGRDGLKVAGDLCERSVLRYEGCSFSGLVLLKDNDLH